ncbi:phosphatase PAP2 family protein [Kitasatospora sp. NPDC101801]|uniref:phosphatase PAP2 family protein n=1 Tax=Kitasatospora sp. NPDC101801 TaxID=3364103 RepID=UPI00382BA722
MRAPIRPRSTSRRHALSVGVVGLLYLLVVLAVLLDGPLVQLDWTLRRLRPDQHWPELRPLLDVWIVAGQRGPSAIAACAWLGWRCHRLRTVRPLLLLGTALLLLNTTVGAVKILTGRLGPHHARYPGSPELFLGGTAFPSGHTANAVVTWGALAYLAVRWRRTGVLLGTVTAVTVGLTTVYLGTHWVSDVLAGWAAGALVLLALPLAEPLVTAADRRITALRRPVSPASSARPARPGRPGSAGPRGTPW